MKKARRKIDEIPEEELKEMEKEKLTDVGAIGIRRLKRLAAIEPFDWKRDLMKSYDIDMDGEDKEDLTSKISGIFKLMCNL